MTTLEHVRKGFNAPLASMQQLKERFAIASQKEMDHVCGILVDNIRTIDDPAEARYFLRKRNEANGLYNRAMENPHA